MGNNKKKKSNKPPTPLTPEKATEVLNWWEIDPDETNDSVSSRTGVSTTRAGVIRSLAIAFAHNDQEKIAYIRKQHHINRENTLNVIRLFAESHESVKTWEEKQPRGSNMKKNESASDVSEAKPQNGNFQMKLDEFALESLEQDILKDDEKTNSNLHEWFYAGLAYAREQGMSFSFKCNEFSMQIGERL